MIPYSLSLEATTKYKQLFLSSNVCWCMLHVWVIIQEVKTTPKTVRPSAARTHVVQNTMPQVYILDMYLTLLWVKACNCVTSWQLLQMQPAHRGKLSHSKNWHQQFSARASTGMRNHPEMWEVQSTTRFELPGLEPRSPRLMSSFHKNFEAQEPTLKAIDWVGWRLCKVLCGGKHMSKTLWNNRSNESSFCLK